MIKKWQSESEPYSPSHEWEKEEQFDVKHLSLEEPSSPLSRYSLTFDGEKWIIPWMMMTWRQTIFYLQEHLHQNQVNLVYIKYI